MLKDNRQLRTTNNKGLIGYRAKLRGEYYIIVAKWKGPKLEIIGIISLKQFINMVRSGPYINLDNYEQ